MKRVVLALVCLGCIGTAAWADGRSQAQVRKAVLRASRDTTMTSVTYHPTLNPADPIQIEDKVFNNQKMLRSFRGEPGPPVDR